jgi:hypothetical protein
MGLEAKGKEDEMKRTARRLACLLPLSFAVLTTAGGTLAQEPSPAAPAPPAIAGVKAPQPTVPEAFTIEGEFVRVAYNNEGYVTLGYRIANGSVGEEWMYLQTGLTLRHGVKSQSIPREAFSVKTPDGKVIPPPRRKRRSSSGSRGRRSRRRSTRLRAWASSRLPRRGSAARADSRPSC